MVRCLCGCCAMQRKVWQTPICGHKQLSFITCMLFVQAQKWLAKKGMRSGLAEASPEEAELDKPRPAGLGLGASFLPHHKARFCESVLGVVLIRFT